MTTKRQVCVAIDDSPHSERAMRWTLGKYVGANDHIELVTVTALPRLSVPEFTLAPLPARSHVPTNVVDQQVEENRNKATRAAIHLLEKYIKLAEACGLPQENISTKVITLSASAVNTGKVGHALADYINELQPTVTVIGSRGMGAVRRKLGSMVGMGSVSDYLINHVSTPVMVVKLAEDEHHHKHTHCDVARGNSGRISSDESEGSGVSGDRSPSP